MQKKQKQDLADEEPGHHSPAIAPRNSNPNEKSNMELKHDVSRITLNF